MRNCAIFSFEGVGSSTILNIGYFLLKGVLPELEHLESESREKVDYNSLINSLQESIQQLTLENKRWNLQWNKKIFVLFVYLVKI